ncbi:Transmembrane protein 220 [Rhynchospora pubera]|uniref:Transmembrane protein 220 n=1 Tax=Rhynchospora pubera TaxID=906938 RepID=A0AAV8D3J7_9POAL|nr:Transmembrane protein 220 [Rhynchospora pubera]
MAMAKNRSRIFSSCSLLMSLLFFYSALVQFNDPDWYFWLPLYSSAFLVNLLNMRIPTKSKTLTLVARLTLVGGNLLFVKVVIEALALSGFSAFWSINMRERVVREKVGSGLVVLSMLLHLKASSTTSTNQKKISKRNQVSALPEAGMALLAVLSYGLSIYAFGFINKEEMKFS